MNFEKGFFYHIYNRGNNSQKVFYNRENYLFFLKKLKKQISPFVSVVSWCLMPNHVHLVVYVHRNSIRKSELDGNNGQTMTSSLHLPEPDSETTLNYAIGVLLRSYTRAIQRQENIKGSLFQQHTQTKALTDEIKIDPAYWNTAFGTQFNLDEGKSYLQTCIEYVHLNPVISGMVRNAEDWEFSSCRDYLGLRDGKLVDFKLLEEEGLIENAGVGRASEKHAQNSNLGIQYIFSQSMTQSHTMTKNIAIIGIGSNIDARKNIGQMLEILGSHVQIVKISTFLKTKPIGITIQPDFTNGAVKVSTELDRTNLEVLLKAIEDEMGRDRSAPKFGSRNIDLDLVVWNGEIVDNDYYTRDFLQQSVAEVI
jgi:putative transposase